jgi:hypothetical protein
MQVSNVGYFLTINRLRIWHHVTHLTDIPDLTESYLSRKTSVHRLQNKYVGKIEV